MPSFPPASALRCMDTLAHEAGKVSGPGLVTIGGLDYECEVQTQPISWESEEGKTILAEELEAWISKDLLLAEPEQGTYLTFKTRQFEIMECEGGHDDIVTSWRIKALCTQR